ncbi:hypothetical protein FIBSPDRAFT_204232 [Athelia psychrophila]|uniref:Uncharacterized protein n=1 Tax=Athelia psychrophila TaxID=1759441 RepID=A0A166WFJ3_9AGAM|nr:hypothetical protein FIBSPDRAFT_204232 [Fibularhizoctonia sp. CBS 109695]
MQVLLIMNSNAIVCNCVIASPRLLLLHSRFTPSQISPIKTYSTPPPSPHPILPPFGYRNKRRVCWRSTR